VGEMGARIIAALPARSGRKQSKEGRIMTLQRIVLVLCTPSCVHKTTKKGA